MEGGPSSLRGSSLSQRSSWIAETFVDATEAITSLCVDHSGFVAREDIMQSIPPRIKALITHPSTMMQIEGFEKLFFHLDTSPGPQILRRFIVAYFNDNPQLRPCLRQAPLLTPASESIPSLQAGPVSVSYQGRRGDDSLHLVLHAWRSQFPSPQTASSRGHPTLPVSLVQRSDRIGATHWCSQT